MVIFHSFLRLPEENGRNGWGMIALLVAPLGSRSHWEMRQEPHSDVGEGEFLLHG